MTASLNPYITKFDEGFDVEKSKDYRLTIQFSLGGLSFAFFDTTSNTIVGIEFYQSDLLTSGNDVFCAIERVLDSKRLGKNSFQTVTCIVDDRVNTLVPKPLFDESRALQYLDFGFQLPSDSRILNDIVKKAEGVNAYALPQELHSKLTAKWPKARFVHSSSLLLNGLLGHDDPARVGVYVCVRNRNFDLLVKKDGELQFFNNFKFNTKDDFVYFLLFALEQCHLQGPEAVVLFCGLVMPDSEIATLCGRYVKEVRFIGDDQSLKVSEALKEIPFHYYFIHYQALKCES